MIREVENFPEHVKENRLQPGLSQEELVPALGVSFVTVNRRENSKISSSKLALRRFEQFFARKKEQGKLS